MRRARLMRACALALCAGTGVGAQAQTIDYEAFEQMFGEPVTSSATGQPQRVSDVPTEMEIITADDIRRSGADNIPDILRFVAGIDVRRYGQLDAAVGIRGMNTATNPRVLVLLDGRQVYQDDYGQTIWPAIPVALSEIRQIEIVKGPSAALYGFNAVSGVINIVTFDPLRHALDTAAVQGGTQNQVSGEGVATWRVPNRLGVRLSVTGFRSDDFTPPPGAPPLSMPRAGTLAVDTRVQAAPNVEWDVSASLTSVDTSFYPDIGFYTPLDNRTNSVRSLVSADTGLGLLQFDLYRNEDREATSSVLTMTAWREDVVVAKLDDLLKIGTANTVRFGLEYRDNVISSSQQFAGRLGYDIFAGSAMWNWQIRPDLSLTNAVRLDDLTLGHHGAQFLIPDVGPLYRDVELLEPSFNSGLVYKATQSDTFRLTAARAIQLPSLLDFGISQNYGVVILAGNPGLTPSSLTNYELDYDRALTALGAVLRTSAFVQRTDDTIGSPFGSGYGFLPTGEVLLQSRNFGTSSEAGGEIGLRSDRAAALRWNVSYALAAVEDGAPQAVLLTASSVSFQRQTPTNAVVVGLGKTLGRLDLDLQARWQSHYDDFAVDPDTLAAKSVLVRNYVTMNARAAYRVTPHVTVSLIAEQINSAEIVEQGGYPVDRRILGGLKVGY